MGLSGTSGRRTWGVGLLLVVAGLMGGCMGERSFPMREDRLVKVEGAEKLGTREWTVVANGAAAKLLPGGEREVLTQDEFVQENGAVSNTEGH